MPVNQVVPATEPQRYYFLFAISDIYHLILDGTQPSEVGTNLGIASGVYNALSFNWIQLKDVVDDEYQPGFDKLDEANISTLSTGHFKWRDLGVANLTSTLECPPEYYKYPVDSGNYHILLVATYWQHDLVDAYNVNNRLLWNFTKDWSYHPRGGNSFTGDNMYWYRREITSSELSFTDKGKASKYEDVYVDSEELEVIEHVD